MGFIPSGSGIKATAQNLGVTAGVTAIRQLSANVHSNSIDKFKKHLGSGFRSNFFTVEFLFKKSFFNALTNGINKNKSGISKDKNGIDLGEKIILANGLQNPLDKLKDGVDKVKSKLLKRRNSSKDSVQEELVAFPLLCTQFQLPEMSLEMSEETVKFKKVVKDKTQGALTSTIMMDQWNYNSSFIWNYINAISPNGETVDFFPDDYKLTIKVYLYSNQWKQYQEHSFTGCTILNKGDQDLNKGNVSDIPTMSLNIDWYKYEIITTKPTFKSVIGVKLYDEDLKMLAILSATNTLKNIYTDVTRQIDAGYLGEMIDKYSGFVEQAKSYLPQLPTESQQIINKFDKLIEDSKIRL